MSSGPLPRRPAVPGWMKQTAAAALYYSGGLRLWSRWMRGRDGRAAGDGDAPAGRGTSFVILVYHRVSDDPDPFSITPVSPRLFDRQIAYLARNHTVLAPRDIARAVRGREPLPGNAIAVTFDDGYRDNYELAFPILARHGVPAAIYLTTGVIGTGIPLWFDRVLAMFRDTSARSVDLAGAIRRFDSAAERLGTAHEVLRTVKYLPPREQAEAIRRLEGQLGGPRGPLPPMLDWEQAAELAEGGIELGAHTRSHRILTTVSAEEGIEEVLASKGEIESRLGSPVHGFAYPNGNRRDFTDDLARRIEAAGFDYAVTNVRGANPPRADRYQWSRESPLGRSVPRLALQLARV